jgi:hypothetical protein
MFKLVVLVASGLSFCFFTIWRSNTSRELTLINIKKIRKKSKLNNFIKYKIDRKYKSTVEIF